MIWDGLRPAWNVVGSRRWKAGRPRRA